MELVSLDQFKCLQISKKHHKDACCSCNFNSSSSLFFVESTCSDLIRA